MSNPIDIIVGRNVRAKRETRGISQGELGAACGVTFQQIQKYESGHTRISASRLVEIHRALGCSILDLFEGVDTKASAIETEMIVLPPAVSKAMANLMQAVTIALGQQMNVARIS